MGFCRQGYWSGRPCPPPGALDSVSCVQCDRQALLLGITVPRQTTSTSELNPWYSLFPLRKYKCTHIVKNRIVLESRGTCVYTVMLLLQRAGNDNLSLTFLKQASGFMICRYCFKSFPNVFILCLHRLLSSKSPSLQCDSTIFLSNPKSCLVTKTQDADLPFFALGYALCMS